MNIPLCPETVKLAKDILLSGKNFKPFDELFVISDKVTAKHELFNQFVELTGCQIPKVFIYIIMDDLFGQCTEIDENKDLGYKLEIKL